MLCTIVLMASTWVNPCQINYFYAYKNRCVIAFSGARSSETRFVKMTCEEVAEILAKQQTQ